MTDTGLIFEHPSSHEHEPGELIPAHPESARRIEAIDAALAAADWLGWERRLAPPATHEELARVHEPALIAHVQWTAAAGGGLLDADTAVTERSYDAALHAAGGACALVRALLEPQAAAGEPQAGTSPAKDALPRAGFAVLRPPGHHAEADRAMGFCLFNNAAVAAQLAIAELGVERVLILDWDVHHGNGTAEIFRERGDVLYASIHRGNFYPGTGPLNDAGSGAGRGRTINLPVGGGTGGDVWRALVEHVVLPAAGAFAPQLILVSAGFDAHAADPLGGCEVQTEDFADMARQVRELGRACRAPVGAILEGGYEPRALADCVLATMRALAGDGEPVGVPRDPLYTEAALSLMGDVWGIAP